MRRRSRRTDGAAHKAPATRFLIAGLGLEFHAGNFVPMNLEDNPGDIIGKARTAANVSAEEAAVAAGLTLEEFSTLEETGRSTKRPDFGALAAKIGLHGPKLEGVANGWVPQQRELGLLRE